MGVRNVLCLTGDGVQTGDHPEAKPVFDMDSISLLRAARIMCEKGHFLSGRQLESSPRFFLGAAANPFVPPCDFRPLRLGKKADAGADFVQTQYCFNLPRMREYMARVRDLGLHRRIYILAGVGPLRSARVAEWMRANVPGVSIPDEIILRMKGVPKKNQKEEGKRLCVEMIQQLHEIEGVAGVHVMAYRQEELVAEIIEEAGLLAYRRRRQVQGGVEAAETDDDSPAGQLAASTSHGNGKQ
jgi:methylenetetrahydrofolate reductase (NADPH)